MLTERKPQNPDATTATAQETDKKWAERLFSSAPISFKMDRKSPEAANLRAAVSQKLLEFLGNYSDDVLAEYIVVLVCNGKHQIQARDDLEAFLGDESEKFVTWLWELLSDQIIVSKAPLDYLDPSTKVEVSHTFALDNNQKNNRCPVIQSSNFHSSKGGLFEVSNFSMESKRPKTIEVSQSFQQHCPGAAPSVEVQASSEAQSCGVLSKFDATTVNPSEAKRHLFSGQTFSPGTLSGGEQCLQYENQHQKITKSNSGAVSCRPLRVTKIEPDARNLQSIIREDSQSKLMSMKSATPTRSLSNAMDVEDAQISWPRRSVWDRLGKPLKDDQSLVSGQKYKSDPPLIERENLNSHKKELQDSSSKLVEQDTTLAGNATKKFVVLDRSSSRIIPKNHIDRCEIQELRIQGSFDDFDKLKRKRDYGAIDSGNSVASFSGCEESLLQDKEAFPQKKVSLPVNYNCTHSSNDLATGLKNVSKRVSETAYTSVKSSDVDTVTRTDIEVISQLDEKTSLTISKQNLVPFKSLSPAKSRTAKDATGSSNARPMQDEMLDVKLKLRQVEMDMLKLRARQADMSSLKSTAPSGLQNNMEEDVESRTVLVTNVHFAASREELLSHFVKCGLITKVIVLTDTVTSQPKGAAFIVFACKESVDKAISLSGTSFFSRILTVMRKAEMPPGLLAPTQPVVKPQQPWFSQPYHLKGAFQRNYTSTHLQWRRDNSASRESSLPASADGLEPSNVGK